MSKNLNFLNELKKFNDIEFLIDEPLSSYTTFKIGGKADYIIKPTNIDQLKKLILQLKNAKIDYCFLGNGSNILVSDNGYRGAVILLSNFNKYEIIDKSKCLVSCQAGVNLSNFCNFLKDNSLTGLEFAYGIPGTVGGAVYMNAGAYDGEMKNVVISCTFINENNEILTYDKSELDFSYRHSYFSHKKCCILSAEFLLENGEKSAIQDKMTELINKRISKQPLEFPSGGSTFKRPEGNYASALITQCGLQGKRVGGAMVSEKHSGFIINYDNATCQDVLDLVDEIKQTVFGQTGYDLECEIKMLGKQN
ncbi:MAG: UDP-N-acetylmuramate dehydrogenase [Oscillospiraceae bacterium]